MTTLQVRPRYSVCVSNLQLGAASLLLAVAISAATSVTAQEPIRTEAVDRIGQLPTAAIWQDAAVYESNEPWDCADSARGRTAATRDRPQSG